MKLWLFGDSFASPPKKEKSTSVFLRDHESWVTKLPKELGVEFENYAVSGSSVEHSVEFFYDAMPNFKYGDCVIFCMTNTARKKLFDYPEKISNVVAAKRNPDIVSKERLEFLEYYFKYFFNHMVEKRNQVNFIHALDNFSTIIGLKVLLINAFPPTTLQNPHPPRNISVSSGSLYDISIAENINHNNNLCFVPDFRTNHLSPINHEIFLKKLLDFFNHDIPVSLPPEEFVSGIYDLSGYVDDETGNLIKLNEDDIEKFKKIYENRIVR